MAAENAESTVPPEPLTSAGTLEPPQREAPAGTVVSPQQVPPASTSPREVIVHFEEPPWHKERLRQVQVDGQRLIDAAKTTRNTFLALLVFVSITASGYVLGWSSAVRTALVVFDGILMFGLFGNFVAEREASDALRTSESLAKLSLTLSTQKPGAEHNYFESLVSINVENLREYYLLVKKHTSYSYRVSLAAGVLGFLLICGALVASYLQGQLTAIAYVGTGAGLIVEFIAGIFFYLYNKTVRQLKGYHDSLLDVQNVLLALKLIESVSKDDVRAPMLQSMIAFLMTKRSIPTDELPKAASQKIPAE